VAAGKQGAKGIRGQGGGLGERLGESLKVALVQTQKEKLKPQPHYSQHYNAICKTLERLLREFYTKLSSMGL
jgi:hypothetical protein